MAASSKTKASDKQGVCKKLVAILKKRYKGTPPKNDRPVLETVIYAVCLEDANDERAEAAYEHLLASFHDLNEIRVSSISELALAFGDLPNPERRALQVRGVLHYVFEKHFGFEFEGLKKKTLELATKQLGKIRDLSPFVRGYTLQEALGSHTLPLDESMRDAVVWLGLADPGSDSEQASQALRPVIRKTEAPQFSYLLRSFATDPAVRDELDPVQSPPPDEGFDLSTAAVRLQELIDRAESGKTRRIEKKPAAKPKAKTKTSAKGAAGKPRTNGAAAKSARGKKTTGKSTRK